MANWCDTAPRRFAVTGQARVMDNVISATEVRRSYAGGFEAVRGVSLSVRAGELFAVLGTNGAGKTSLLEVLEGLAPATSGDVRVLGENPYTAKHLVRSRIGIMAQEAGLPADLTVAETATMWAGTLTAARPTLEALGLVGLLERRTVLVRQLSGGERRRLDLALAIMGRPQVLFLDEPTAGLDPEGRVATWQLVRSLLAEGSTVVLTTHFLAEAEELADRVAILHAGRVVRTGTPAEVSASRPARISFTLPGGSNAALPELPGVVRIERSPHGHVLLHTTELQPCLATLVAWADVQGVGLADLNARPASLEEAFLSIADAEAVAR